MTVITGICDISVMLMESSLDKTLKTIEKFFLIKTDDNFGENVFKNLQDIIEFESGYIYFTNPRELVYSFNKQDNLQEPMLVEELRYKNNVFGEIIITGKEFCDADRTIFKTCASVIANITKDIEIAKIIKMQIQALQSGCREVKESEQLKTKFLSHVSHELRTPLNSIIGYSDLLSNEFVGSLNDKQKEYLNEIKVSGIYLLGMINEILDMSKIEAGAMSLNLTEFNITQPVEEVVNTIKPLLLLKNINLIQEISDFTFKADCQKIRQILFNLLSNAIKYTPEGGIIKIKAKKISSEVKITVEDNGVGIDEADLERIFDKFEQIGNAKGASTGLGLTITRELVHLHGGVISVKSKKSYGTTFEILFNC